MKIVVCYDIKNTLLRTKVSDFLCNYLYRVQKSVFEGFATNKEFDTIVSFLDEKIDKEDTIRIYKLCNKCDSQIKLIGFGEQIIEKDFIII